MSALLSEKELERKAENATAIFNFDPSDTFYWRAILEYAKDEGFLVTWWTGSVHTALIRKTA